MSNRPDATTQIPLSGPHGKNGWLRTTSFRSHANVKWEVASANQEDFLECLLVENWDEELMRRLMASHYKWSTLGPRIFPPWQSLPHVTHDDAAHLAATLPGVFFRACRRYEQRRGGGAPIVMEAKPVAKKPEVFHEQTPKESREEGLPRPKPTFRYCEAGSD